MGNYLTLGRGVVYQVSNQRSLRIIYRYYNLYIYIMNRYTNIKVHVSEGQKDKIKRAVEAGVGVNIRLSHEDLSGEHILALTKAQINKMTKAYRGGTGITIKMSKSQLHHNMKSKADFFQLYFRF